MKRSKKNLTILFIMLSSFICFTSFTNHSPKGVFENNTDIGQPKLSGQSVYNPENDEYTMRGAGYNIWFDRDEFQFLWKKVSGDFILQARMKFIGKGVNAHRKIGIMLRDSLTDRSSQVNGVIHGDGLTSLQFRKKPGDQTSEIRSVAIAPTIMQLERKGNLFILSTAIEGQAFITVETSEVNLNSEVYAGLFICSHDSTIIEEAVFENVRIIIPAKADFVPYKDYIGSHIEIMNVETGKRKIVLSSFKSLQAPNWKSDGGVLVFNSEGKLFSFDINTSEVKEIPTGFAVNNNNDHVLSFDGKLQGISDHTKHPNNQSLVYVLPSDGGEPEQITKEGPSYLHGFSPDGNYLVYTAGRNNADNLDIYKYSRTTKMEVQITNSPGLDDGSEYSPDGKYIYFNSTRTGLMQIWRMKPDGSDQEQLTFDESNNWFPHISPNGKWIVFITYGTEIKADDHPFYKRVYIRMMPAEGGEPKVIAYLYGGQGSMNVFNWSPDSRQISFVSNTIIEE
jgi:TolB protein